MPQNGEPAPARWGSVVVEQAPKATGTVVAGQIVLTDHRSDLPANLDEELAMPEMEGSSILSMTTDHSEEPPLIAVTDLSSEVQKIAISCFYGAKNALASHIKIAPHATATTLACSAFTPATFPASTALLRESPAPGVYGVSLIGDGNPGSLAAFAVAPHLRGHDLVFSAAIFHDPETVHSSDMVFAGVPIASQETLPVGVYRPRLSLANYSDAPMQYSFSLADKLTSPVKSKRGDVRPPAFNVIHTGTLAPHQTGEYVFSRQEAQSGLLHSIILTTANKPGSYEAKLVSRSTGSLYQVELLAKEALELNNSGVDPWTVQGDTASHIILFNHSKSDQKVGVYVRAGATLWSHELFLSPLETREISINKLPEGKIVDDKGKTLRASVTDGVVTWMTPISGVVTGRLMVTSRDAAMARNFSCGTYSGECGLNFNTLQEYIDLGQDLPMYSATGQVCLFPPRFSLRSALLNWTPNLQWPGQFWAACMEISDRNNPPRRARPRPMSFVTMPAIMKGFSSWLRMRCRSLEIWKRQKKRARRGPRFIPMTPGVMASGPA